MSKHISYHHVHAHKYAHIHLQIFHLPIPFVPPVTNAVFDFKPQKLGGGGGGTENSLVAQTTDTLLLDNNEYKSNNTRIKLHVFDIIVQTT